MLRTLAPGPKLTRALLRMRVSVCSAEISEVIVALDVDVRLMWTGCSVERSNRANTEVVTQ